MRILVAPDSFKGSITSERFCRVIKQAAKRKLKDFTITAMPLADGGEGTAALLADAMDGYIDKTVVEGPFGKETNVKIAFVNGGRTAVIESAQSIGHTLAGRRANPLRTSSFGVGQMISYATAKGARQVILTLGGSCTNDLGAGMLSAMGVSFVDICGNRFSPVGGSLERVESVEYNQAFSKYREVEFIILCDVDNPLLGESGCAKVFAPQKGADEAAVARLEQGARKFATVTRRVCGADYKDAKGAGAAGGIGYGAMSYLNAKPMRGIDAVFKIYGFDRAVSESDLIITGEGRFDYQSFMGKAVGGVLSQRESVPTVIICGSTDGVKVPDGVEVIPIGDGLDLQYSMDNAVDLILAAAEKLFERYK